MTQCKISFVSDIMLQELLYIITQNILRTVKEIESRIAHHKTKAKGKNYSQWLIYLPSHIANDSAFPFKANDRIIIKIIGDRLVIEKKE